jgi:hypothetical protein
LQLWLLPHIQWTKLWTHCYNGKFDTSRNVGAERIFGIYLHSTHFYVFVYASLDIIAEIWLASCYTCCLAAQNDMVFLTMWLCLKCFQYNWEHCLWSLNRIKKYTIGSLLCDASPTRLDCLKWNFHGRGSSLNPHPSKKI